MMQHKRGESSSAAAPDNSPHFKDTLEKFDK